MADRPTARRCRICRAPEHGRHKMSCDYARYPSRFPDGPVYVDAPAPKGRPIQGTGYTPAQMLGAGTDRLTPRLDVLIDRACRHLTPDEGAALRAGWAGLERAREERGTYRAAWHSARDRARKHRAAVDDMWDANTRLAQRARRAEKQLADERAEHLQAHEQETANTAREIGRAQRAEQQLAAVRALHARNANTGTCEHCSERDYPDYAVPWPCPTIAALDAAGQLDCPGETDPPTCNCPCEGCQHHCAAHQPDTCRTVDIDGETIRVRAALDDGDPADTREEASR